MRRRKVLFLLLIAIICVHGVFLAWRVGWIASLPLLGPYSKTETAQDQPVSLGRPQVEDTTRPTFDVVRAEPSGDVIMAGRAEPGWTVSVESGGKHIGTAVANDSGEWIIQPSKPITVGEHSLTLKAQSAKGGRTLFSKQRLMLSLETQGGNQPLVALTEEGKPTRVLQRPPNSKATSPTNHAALAKFQSGKVPPSKQVTFSSIDYEEGGEKSVVRFSGYVGPGIKVSVYIDNEHVGTASADATGRWSFAANRELSGGKHDMRADALENSGKVISRAEVSFNHEAPNPELAEEKVSPEIMQQTPASGEAPSSVAQSGEETEANGADLAQQTKKRVKYPTAVVIKSGDTLWQIAERYYGNGAKYTQIFRNNRGQIRDPDLIYPNQRFVLPKR
ncbi:MAG: LysM peptidoglycan-binding domain-containing protein [Alphaproteobacteria bacterium]